MRFHLYEHPVKSGLRRIVREILLAWFALALLLFIVTGFSHGCYASGDPRHYVEGCWPSVG